MGLLVKHPPLNEFSGPSLSYPLKKKILQLMFDTVRLQAIFVDNLLSSIELKTAQAQHRLYEKYAKMENRLK
jgi:hypothetical protein